MKAKINKRNEAENTNSEKRFESFGLRLVAVLAVVLEN